MVFTRITAAWPSSREIDMSNALRRETTDYKRPHVRNINLLKPERGRGASLPFSAQPAKRLKEEFDALFTFERTTTGSDILVLRSFMHQQGFPEIPECRSIHCFATLFARFVLPRREWPLFTNSEEDRAKARQFCKQWASALLPRMVKGGKPKRQRKLHKDMVPELAAFYNPAYLGHGVH
jgi:hypothetical protein